MPCPFLMENEWQNSSDLALPGPFPRNSQRPSRLLRRAGRKPGGDPSGLFIFNRDQKLAIIS
jgi:hypothetical protein